MTDRFNQEEFFDDDFSQTNDDPILRSIMASSSIGAIIHRNYLIAIDGNLHQLDYVVYHQNGFLTLIKVFEVLSNETLQIFTHRDLHDELEMLLEVREFYQESNFSSTFHFYPLRGSQKSIKVIKARLEAENIPVSRFQVILYLTNSPENNNFQLDPEIQIAVGEKELSEFIRGIRRSDTIINDEQWEKARQILIPIQLYRDLTSDVGREIRYETSQLLSQEYSKTLNKNVLIFVSYRREDSGWAAGRIFGHLKSTFAGDIFFDFDSIKLASDWADALNTALDDCAVVLVVIGKKWLTEKRHRRLFNPNDWVKREIRLALSKDKVVIPIIIDGARVPKAIDLPHGIRRLPNKQSLLLNLDNFFAKMNILVDRINELLEESIKSAKP
jgi:hypothetical protein